MRCRAFKQRYLAARCRLGCVDLALPGFVCFQLNFGVDPTRSGALNTVGQQSPRFLA
jgi:hypothetical protein